MRVRWLVNFMNPEYNTGKVVSISGDWCVVKTDKFLHAYQNPFVILRLADTERIQENGK